MRVARTTAAWCIAAVSRALGAAVVSLVFPGFGHGMVRRRWQAIGWAISGFLPVILVILSVWMGWIAIVLRVACAIDTVRVVRRDGEGATWLGTWAAIAVVVGSIGIGYAKLTIQAFKIPSSSMSPTILIGDHVYVDTLTIRWRPPERGEIVVIKYPCARETTHVKRVVAIGGDSVEVRCNVLYVNGTMIPSQLLAAQDDYHDYADGRWFGKQASRYRETLGDHTYDTFHDPERPLRDAREATAGDRHDFPQRDAAGPPTCHASGFYEDRVTAVQPIGKLVQTKAADEAKPCEPQLHFVVPDHSVFGLGDNRSNSNDSRYWGVVPTEDVIGRVTGTWLSDGEHGVDWGRVGPLQ